MANFRDEAGNLTEPWYGLGRSIVFVPTDLPGLHGRRIGRLVSESKN